MVKMCLFSVIMPVYNAGAYLENAVNSILCQTFENFELILVDDGSMDGSAEKCDLFAQKDNRIKVLHILNSGISNARNVGMKMAEGEYLAFCDHDDEYSNILLETVGKYIDVYDRPDVLKYVARQVKVWGKCSIRKNVLPHGLIMTRELVNDYKMLLNFQRYIWDGVYKRDFIEKNLLYFDETITRGGEDCYFNTVLFEKVDSIVSISQCLYTHYYRVGQSTSTKYNASNFDVYMKIAKKEYSLIKSYDLDHRTFARVIIMHKARFVTAVASDCIYKTGCGLNRQEIQERIESVRSSTVAYGYKDSAGAFFYLFRKCFKWGLLYSAFSLKQTWLMYLIMRWNQRLRYKK